jgi:hypothetical protein
MTWNKSSDAGPQIDEMNAMIEMAERAKNFADDQHQQLIAAFKQYLAGKSLGKEDAEGLKDPGAVHEG